MFTDKLWITNGVKKVKNPVKYQGVTDIYQGQINPNYDFKHQTLNFLNIKNSLEPFNIYPTDIYLGMRVGKSLFTVCFSNPDIFWSKYEGEGYGRLFQDMVPKKSLSHTQTSLGSNVELEIHTEQAFSELRPDILTLGCLRGDENAITYILPVNIILNQMDEAKINLLRKPLWKIGVDLSFKINCDEFINGNVRGPIPILYGPENHPLFVFDQDLMKGINEEAENLKNEIIEILAFHIRITKLMQFLHFHTRIMKII